MTNRRLPRRNRATLGPGRTSVLSRALADYVRTQRLTNRLGQAELADLAGVGRRFISELEGGKPTLRLDVVDAVLAVFGKTLGVVEAPRLQDESDEA